METDKRASTRDLIKILQDNTHLQAVTVASSHDIREFWEEYATAVQALDVPISASDVLEFAENDTLELINKGGRLLKRFAKWYKTRYGMKLSDGDMGKLGDTLQYHLNAVDARYFVDFTDNFDWNDGQFGKNGSCYWGCYKDSLPSLQEGGGWAIRFYNDENQNDDNGIGRTWILPKDGRLLCFNSYGIDRPKVSKVIKRIFDANGIALHYVAVDLYNSNNDNIPYINGGTGFCLYQHGDSVSKDDKIDLGIEVEEDERDTCEHCGARMDEGEAYFANDCIYCESCYNEYFSSCDKCGESYLQDEVNEVVGHSRYSYLCNGCMDDVDAMKCEECGNYEMNCIVTDDTERTLCEDCAETQAFYCNDCSKHFENSETCPDCTEEAEEVSQ